MPQLPLELMSAGETARIIEIDGDPSAVARLHELGLNPGVEISMVQSGEPCIIALGNHRLSIRCDESAAIFVETP